MIKRNVARGTAGLAALLLTSATLTACGGGQSEAPAGGGDASPPAAGEPEKTELTVGVLPLADLAPFFLAIEDGLFEDEGLQVEANVASGGAAQIAAMVAGDLDLTYSNYVSVLEARGEGLPLQIVRENNRSGPQGIYAMPDSGITDPAALEGRSIAVNSLGNIQELTARAVLESHGVDPASLEFVELPPADMPAALEEGHVDAAWLVEPFITLATGTSDAKRIVSAFEGPTENLPVAGWVATEQFVAENPNTVAAFVRAMDEAMRIAVDEPERLEEIIPTYTSITPELVTQLNPPGLAEDSDLSDLDTLQDLMVEQGIIEEGVDLEAVVVDRDELPQA
ncbi:ABC transporter substrate-binding protein [Georgenia sp. AZ-5]|uniref:ABC transporter substrate-binding protein n=1 Tax=Georgenia sp. AZ-5 TaxID=3367526 RepID=UPI003754884E